jgi:hypothetical protein
VELSEYHQWWKHQGGPELRRLLMERWDPIGVGNAPEAAGEYDGYRGGAMALLRNDATASEIAEYLALAEHESMGIGNGDPSRNLTLAGEIVRWYPDSIARWEATR